ncbi:MAG: magnesium transporter CorA family protein [Planctomycetaceae bacterium]|nr:magnesium transporter CorA family protein [Planctomycetaceae bacterium]
MPASPHPLLPAAWSVPEVFRHRLGSSAGRQRAMLADGHLLLVLHDVPAAGSAGRTPRLFWRAADGAWKASDGETGTAALEAHLQKFAARVEQLEADEDEATRAADYFELLQQIVPLLRSARNLHATLQQARDSIPADRALIHMRDRAGELERSVELLHADVQNGLTYTVAHQAEEQAKRTHEMAVAAHRLNVLAAIFFPMGTLAAIFGMNLTHGLEQWNSPWAFWLVLGCAFMSGLVLAALVVRRPAPPPPQRQSSVELARHSRRPPPLRR